MATNLVFAQFEAYDKKLPQLFSTVSTIANLIKNRADKTMISERDFRVPAVTTEGGRPGTFNPDAGAIGAGSYQEGFALIATYFPWRFNWQLPLLAQEATGSGEQATLKALQRAMKEGLPQCAAYVDRVWHMSDSTASLGTATAQTTTGGNTVYTMNFSQGVRAFRVGEFYVPYANGLGTVRDAGVARKLIAIDYGANTITFSGTVTSAAATDQICFEGAGNITSPPGPHGLAYHNTTTTSGNFFAVSKTTQPELNINLVNGSGGLPTTMKGLQMQHKIFNRRGKASAAGLECIMGTDQQANIRQKVLDISNFDLTKGKMNEDIMPSMDETFNFAGTKARLSLHTFGDRIDYTVWDDWILGTLNGKDWQFYKAGQDYLHTLYDSTSGAPAAATWFSYYALFDWIRRDQGVAGMIYNLAQATY